MCPFVENRPTMEQIAGFPGISHSQQMQDILHQAKKYAQIPRPVLIIGERGTGKELIARYIHQQSARSRGPFVAINCAAFNDDLLIAEIYGHEKGAFTGATHRTIGKMEQANKGTLFLDEVGNMSIPFQERILRVLEYQEFERIRGVESIKVDVRVISATNADLQEHMEDKLFRRDLYDRLTFAEIQLPALRERKQDLPHLIVHFVLKLHEEIPNLAKKMFRRETVEAMMDYHWPGNIRELKNVVERLYVFINEPEIRVDDLPAEITGRKISGATFDEKVMNFKKQLIEQKLVETNHNQRRAARELGMTYHQLRHYYRKYFKTH